MVADIVAGMVAGIVADIVAGIVAGITACISFTEFYPNRRGQTKWRQSVTAPIFRKLIFADRHCV